MPRAKHLVTPTFGWEYPELGAEADVPTDLHELLLQIEATVKTLEPKYLKTAGAGDAKKLLVVGATGAPAFVAMSGDATISEAGALAIGNEKITTALHAALSVTEAILGGEAVGTAKVKALAITAAKLAAEAVETAKIKNLAVTEEKLAALAVGTAKLAELCVTEAKIADGAVSSRKHKPTSGGAAVTVGGLVTTEAYQLIPGIKIELTPPVASHMHLFVTLFKGAGAGYIQQSMFLDTVDSEQIFKSQTEEGSIFMFWRVSLTAALHTVEIRSKRGATAASIISNGTGGESRFQWFLTSQ